DRDQRGWRERYPDRPQRKRNEVRGGQQQRHPDRQIFGQPAYHVRSRRPARSCRDGDGQRALSTASARRVAACSGLIVLFFTYSVITSIIAAVMPFSCAMLCARL